MKYLKKFDNISENSNLTESFISDSYDSIINDLKEIFDGLNYMDEPDMSYKKLYNKLLSIKHKSEEILDGLPSNITGGNNPWDDIKNDLEDISKYCYRFTKSKISLEKLKDII